MNFFKKQYQIGFHHNFKTGPSQKGAKPQKATPKSDANIENRILFNYKNLGKNDFRLILIFFRKKEKFLIPKKFMVYYWK